MLGSSQGSPLVTTTTIGTNPIYEHEYLHNDRQRSGYETIQDPNLPSSHETYRAQAPLSPTTGRSTSPEDQMDKWKGEHCRYHDKNNTHDFLNEMEGAMESWIKWLEE